MKLLKFDISLLRNTSCSTGKKKSVFIRILQISQVFTVKALLRVDI